jgi:hypothetical protein
MKSIILTLADMGAGFVVWTILNHLADKPLFPTLEQMAWYLVVLSLIRYHSRGGEDA